jgi:hypothetical protein
MDGSDVMAAKKSILAQQASELGEAVTRLFTGQPPLPDKPAAKRSRPRKAAKRRPAKKTKRTTSRKAPARKASTRKTKGR